MGLHAPSRVDHVERERTLYEVLTPEQRVRQEEIAGRYPVHRTLTTEIMIRTRLVPVPGEG